MANISGVEKTKLEKIFSMGSGYVLTFSNNSLQRFVHDTVGFDIYHPKYSKYGESKANHLRSFWEIESDNVVGKLIEEMLTLYQLENDLGDTPTGSFNQKLFDDCLQIAYRLQNKKVENKKTSEIIEDFLERDVDEIAIGSLKIDGTVTGILERRIIEVKQCLDAGASLAVIFLCGSILEGLLLGLAISNPMQFNKAEGCPKEKDTEKPKLFHQWTLNNFIDVAYELGFIGLDVKKHGHSLRDFRNYIHPFEQMSSGFTPDSHTAEISWQVLKAAMHDISEKVK